MSVFTIRTGATVEKHRSRRGALSGRRLLVLALAVSLLCHGLLATGASGPVWMDDEVGYLGNAAFIAGVDQPRFASLGYWGGWSLLLAPLYVVLDDPGAVYAAAVALSALLGALVVLPAYALARSVGAAVPVAVTAAVVVTNVPDRTVMSNYALSENALVLATFVAAACMFAATTQRRRSGVLYVSATVASLAAFGVHARAAPLVGACVLVGLTLATRRAERLTGAVVAAVGIVGGLTVYRLNSLLVEAVYRSGSGRREGNLLALVTDFDLGSLALPASGQAWYQIAAWAGLSLAGGALVLGAAVSEARTKGVRFSADAWLLVTSCGGVLLSLVAVSGPIGRGSTRIDFYFYGRYITHLAAVLALLGLVWVLTRATRRQVGVLAVSLVLIAAVFLPRGGTYGDVTRVFPPINVPAVTPFPWPSLSDVGGTPFLWSTLSGIGVLLLVFCLRRRPWLVAVVCLVLSVVAGQTAAYLTVDRFDRPVRQESLPFRHTLEHVDEEAVVLVGVQPFYRNGYQFWLWPSAVRSPATGLDLDLGEREVAVASANEGRLEESGARIIVCEQAVPTCLWVPPGTLQSELEAEGKLALPEGQPLPAAARVGALELIEVSSTPFGGVDGLVVRVRHEGTAAPWPALGTQEAPSGVVRLLLTWDGGSTVADLPRSLLPGAEVDVRAMLPLLPPDVESVRVELIVEGRPGAEFDGEPLVADVG